MSISLRDFNAIMVFRHVIINGIQRTSAIIRATTVEKIIENKLGIDTSIAAKEDSNHSHVTDEHAPKNMLAFLRKYFAV